MTRGAALHYDDTNMHRAAVGANGIGAEEWEKQLPALKQAKQAVMRLTSNGTQGFAELPFETQALNESTRMAQRIARQRFTDLVVLGIGGSDLGARMLHQALGEESSKKKGNIRIHFAGSSTDPDELHRLLKSLNLYNTCINIVSKSGGTLEPMAAFLVFRDRLIHEVGSDNMPAHIIATTDESNGILRQLVEQEGYESLRIPHNVGGRFSVLSSAGLFPAIAAGIDARALLKGARDMVSSFRHTPASTESICRYAALHAWGVKKKMPIHAIVPYTPRLAEFGRWYRQLFAESLGKAKTTKGRGPVGVTPLACVGPEDQHSQLQLWSEGPADKLITFIEVTQFASSLRTPSAATLDPTLASFGRRTFEDLIHLERHATAESLRRDKRPNGTLFLDKLDATAMGHLTLFFELAVAVMGELLHVDAYNQPGVEQSKAIMKEALSVARP